MSEDKAAGGDVGGSGGGTNKIVLIASLVNMVATVGVVAVLMLSHQKEASQPTVDDIVKGQAKGGHGGEGGHSDAKAEHGGGEHGGGEHGGGEHGGGGKPEEAVTDAGKINALDPFTVNLTTGIGTTPRYVRMNVSVELEQGVPDKEFDIKLPRVRDTIINLLNSKKALELNTVEGREQLKEEIKKSLNVFMMQSKVKGIYFTNFAISN